MFNLLDYDIAFRNPRRVTDVGGWHLHIPFAFVITALLKPKRFVELGTHKGDSYCAFCQAAHELDLDTACYAVDSWQGDDHAGFYGEEVFESLRAYHDPLYGGFSTLMRCLFDDALDYFSDRSIDLMHIDGHHSYDSVMHDFEVWLPKMTGAGVMLFHDTNVREREFGVWRFWDEISDQFPHFEFKFGSGLGVLVVGDRLGEDLQGFLEYANQNEARLTQFFYNLGSKIELDFRQEALPKQLAHLKSDLQEVSEQLRQHQDMVQDKDLQLNEFRAHVADKDRQLEDKDFQFEEQTRQLAEIYATKGWKWLTRFRTIRAGLSLRPKKEPNNQQKR